MDEEVYLHGVHVHAEVALRRPGHVLVTLLSQHYKQSRVADPNPGVLVEIGSVFGLQTQIQNPSEIGKDPVFLGGWIRAHHSEAK